MESQNRLTLCKSRSWGTSSSRPHPPLAIIFSDGEAVGPRALTSRRCKAALPFAGKYRLIDLALSSCVNAGIERVGVIAQYQPRSLQAHLGDGRPWDLDRASGGLTLLNPYQTRAGMDWYSGTADAIHQNQAFILRQRSDDVLILPGDQVYQLDLSVLTAQHLRTGAALTLAVAATDEQTGRLHHTVAVDDDGRVRALLPPTAERPGPWTVMGVLLFSTDVLIARLSEDAEDAHSTHDLVADLQGLGMATYRRRDQKWSCNPVRMRAGADQRYLGPRCALLAFVLFSLPLSYSFSVPAELAGHL